jgi:hypothetical protein
MEKEVPAMPSDTKTPAPLDLAALAERFQQDKKSSECSGRLKCGWSHGNALIPIKVGLVVLPLLNTLLASTSDASSEITRIPN